jgi:N-acetylmuramoyl-L-alanine amidase
MRLTSRQRGRMAALLLAVMLTAAVIAPRAVSSAHQSQLAAQTPAPPAAGQTAPGAPPPSEASGSPLPGAATPHTPLPGPRNFPFFVMIDPGHGGNDPGGQLSTGHPEKELTLSLARRLKAEFAERGIPARLLREGDTSLSPDERAETSNEQHAAVFISLHAGAPGRGIRVYAPALASPPLLTTGRFLPWENAQALYLVRSRALAGAVATELRHRRLEVASLSLPLRPLNNVAASAIAVELVDDDEESQVTSPKLQNSVAAAIAAAVAQMRSQMEGQP